jgi:hypothetical protein
MKHFIHPEQKKGEIFFTNSNYKAFDTFHLSSKRRGVFAYDGEGNLLSHEDWFPVFISEHELKNAKESLSFLRMEFKKRWV